MRYLTELVKADLEQKMVFIGGPRQVGKTTLALSFLGAKPPLKAPFPPSYVNWDFIQDKEALIRGEIPEGSLLILDEIHKYGHWRNLVKGIFDKYRGQKKILVTGSARLDYYSKGGDSLVGRYHYYRLHPFSLGEFDNGYTQSSFEQLFEFSGFPEPLFAKSKRIHRRWQIDRLRKVIAEDLASLERVNEVSHLEVLISALPKRVGSPLSLNALREDLNVSHESIKRWLGILENLYVGFSIMPYGSDKIRAVKKEKKFYFWDWTQCKDNGSRFENLVACQLLKFCHLRQDWDGIEMELRYIRDRSGKEVDFVVLEDGIPLFAVECKWKKDQLDPNIKYFSERLPEIPIFYQVNSGTKEFGHGPRIKVCPFPVFCKQNNMP